MGRPVDLLPAESSSRAETVELGRALGGTLVRGDVVALYGDLGSGKTVFTKGIGSALGIPESRIHSPTFTILNEYVEGSIPLYHFDAYRIESMDEFFDLGYEDYFFGEGICVVEWADRVQPLLPGDAVRIHLEHAVGGHRLISLAGGGDGIDE